MSAALDLIPGASLKFAEPEEEKLSKVLRDIVGELEDQHAPLLANINTWWDWYHAKPLTATRSTPWPNASNVVVPLIRIHSDAISSRLFNTTFAAKDLWTSRTRNDMDRPVVKSVIEFMNWAGDDNDFDLAMPSLDWFGEAAPIGTSVLGLNWRRRVRQVFLPQAGGRPKPISVETHRGPSFEQIPREDILWQANRAIQDAEIIVRRSLMTWTEISRMASIPESAGGWNAQAVADIEGKNGQGASTGRARTVTETKAKHAGVESTGPMGYEPYDIREIWIEQPLLKSMEVDVPGKSAPEAIHIPLVVTMHMDTGRILRVIAKPYLFSRWPFYDINYRRRGKRGHHDGLAKMLEHMQRGVTTSVNQSFDTVTLANSIIGITNNPRLIDEKLGPNKLLYTSDPTTDFQAITLNKLIQPDIVLVNLLMGFAERVSGIADANLGQETRLGGHPSPATNTLAMLQESRELLKTTLKEARQQYSRMGEDVASLYQQFGMTPDGKLQRLLGEQDAELVEKWMFPTDQPIEGNIPFDLRAVSESMNPEAERERALFVSQVTTEYYSRVMQIVQVIQQSQGQAQQGQGPSPMVQVSIKAMEALTESYSRVLDASNVDDVEKFLLDLKGNPNGADASQSVQQFGNEIGGRLREVAAGNAGPAVPTGPAGLPLGANGAASRGGI